MIAISRHGISGLFFESGASQAATSSQAGYHLKQAAYFKSHVRQPRTLTQQLAYYSLSQGSSMMWLRRVGTRISTQTKLRA